MRAFITGASGFVGSHLVDFLLAQDWQVRALVHKNPVVSQERIEVVEGDIRDFRDVKDALEGVDVLFHLAAALGASLIGRQEFRNINVHGTENILRAAREKGIRKAVHLSSAGVLGAVKKNEAAAEDYPVSPKNIYDQTKLEGENIARWMAREGMNIVIIRPGWTYGPRDRRTYKLVKAIHKGRFLLVTKGKTKQTPVYIQDLVRGIFLCAEKGRQGELYHLAGSEVLPIKEIVETIADAAGKKIPPFRLPLFPVRLAAGLLAFGFSNFNKEAPLTPSKLSFFIHPKPLSIQKAGQELGYSPEFDFKRGMALTLAWYKKNHWL